MTLITAHSGCDGTADNSIEFLDYAFGRDVDCLELDVRRDGEGRMILSHDKTGSGAPLLETAFDMLKKHPEKMINCDLKEENMELPVLELAKEYGVENQIIYSGEVNLDLIGKDNSQLEPVKIFLNIENLLPEVYEEPGVGKLHGQEYWKKVKNALDKIPQYEIQCINVDYHLWKEPFKQFLGDRNGKCSLWTVNEKGDIKSFLEDGVYNITTRTAKAALKIREEAGIR